jgi:TPP-dependent indolepyruvate ferredoxin oxidoreductase alpha subunit
MMAQLPATLVSKHAFCRTAYRLHDYQQHVQAIICNTRVRDHRRQVDTTERRRDFFTYPKYNRGLTFVVGARG